MPNLNRLEADPDALSILLRGQTPLPRYSEDDEALRSMIPEEQLFQAQEEIGERGAQRGRPYAIPSREALQQSGMSELRKLFGLQQAKAQAQAYPQQIAGEYGLQRERERSRGTVEAARVRGDMESTNRLQGQAFQQAQQGRQQTFQGEQGDKNRTAYAQRATQAQGAAQGGREYTQGQINARTDAKKPFNLWGWLTSKGDSSGQPAPSANPAIADAVAQLRQTPGAASLSFQQLMQAGAFGDQATPEELAEFQAAWGH